MTTDTAAASRRNVPGWPSAAIGLYVDTAGVSVPSEVEVAGKSGPSSRCDLTQVRSGGGTKTASATALSTT